MILAVDFDGVLHDYKNPIQGRRMGAPIEGAKEALDLLISQGHRIIIFSVWGDHPKPIEDWCQYWHIPYHEITAKKPNADVFVDDKAIPFHGNWQATLKAITDLTSR